MGYLAELLDKKGMKPFIRFAKGQLAQTYNPLDPLGADDGEYYWEWKLKLNISEGEIMDLVNKHY